MGNNQSTLRAELTAALNTLKEVQLGAKKLPAYIENEHLRNFHVELLSDLSWTADHLAEPGSCFCDPFAKQEFEDRFKEPPGEARWQWMEPLEPELGPRCASTKSDKYRNRKQTEATYHTLWHFFMVSSVGAKGICLNDATVWFLETYTSLEPVLPENR